VSEKHSNTAGAASQPQIEISDLNSLVMDSRQMGAVQARWNWMGLRLPTKATWQQIVDFTHKALSALAPNESVTAYSAWANTMSELGIEPRTG